MTKKIVIAAVIAVVASMLIGGLWSLLALPGGPGPVFALVFAAVFFFSSRQQRPSDNTP